MTSPSILPPPEATPLQMLEVGVRKALPPTIAANLSLRSSTDYLTGSLVAEMRSFLYAQPLATDTVTSTRVVSFESPASTWQMFKKTHSARWWMRWYVKRRPVGTVWDYRTVRLTATWQGYATFPDATRVIQSPELGTPVYYSRVDHVMSEGEN